MPKVFQPSLSGGELSPNLYARVDISRYPISVKTCKNFIVRPYGGVENRPGLQYLGNTKFEGTGSSVRLLPFVISSTVSYVIELGSYYMRFWQNGLPVMNGASPYELVSPYHETHLAFVNPVLSADVMTLYHPDFIPKELRRTSTTPTFSLVDHAPINGPFLDFDTTGTFVHFDGPADGTGTLTATQPVFLTAHVDSLVYIEAQSFTEIPPWEPSKRLAAAGTNPYGLRRRSDGKVYECDTNYVVPTGGNPIITGTVRPTHAAGIEADGDGNEVTTTADKAGVRWRYLHSGFGIVRITSIVTANAAIATVVKRLPNNVLYGNHVEASSTATGNGTATVFSLPGATSYDREGYQVTVAGKIKDVNSYTVSPVLDQVTFLSAPASGAAITLKQVAQDNRTGLWAFGAWNAWQGYPSVAAYYGDRLVAGGTRSRPDTLWFSKTSNYIDHGTSVPGVDDDAITRTLLSRQVNEIRDIVPLDSLLVLTSGTEWKITGGQEQVITNDSFGAKPQSYRGASTVRAVTIGASAIYLQNRGKVIRDLAYTLDSDGYDGNDLTVFADHLFADTVITEMAYQQTPWSVLWCVRSDGVLLGLTYMREQQILAWHRHHTVGLVESIAVVPENMADVLYVAVKRTIGGVNKRYIEKFTARDVSNPKSLFFVDSGLSFNGAYSGLASFTLTGTGWTTTDTLTCTASQATFNTGDVGDKIKLTRNGETVVFDILSYTNNSVISVRPLSLVPVGLRAVAIGSASFLRDVLTGLGHLEGQTVAICGDGLAQPTRMVSGGSITLATHAEIAHVGLPYESEIEMLDIQDSTGEGRAVVKAIPRVDIVVRNTRGLKVGSRESELYDASTSGNDSTGDPLALLNGRLEHIVTSTWNDRGRVLIRQTNPLPATILAVIPEVTSGR